MLHANDVTAGLLGLCTTEKMSHRGLVGGQKGATNSFCESISEQVNGCTVARLDGCRHGWMDSSHPSGGREERWDEER